MATTRVFISRALVADSVLRQWLEDQGLAYTARSLVDFTSQPVSRVPTHDWVFFYSPRAVTFFVQQLQALDQPFPTAPVATMGPGTAAAVVQHGGQVDLVGQGRPAEVARQLLDRAGGQRVLFPQARQSRQSVERILGRAIIALPLVVYDNQPVAQPQLDYHNWLVFTSPLNAATYYAHYAPQPQQRVIAIGETTRRWLHHFGLDRIEVAPTATEAGLIAVLRSVG